MRGGSRDCLSRGVGLRPMEPTPHDGGTPPSAQPWTWAELEVAIQIPGPASTLHPCPTSAPAAWAWWVQDPPTAIAKGRVLWLYRPGPTAPRPSWVAAEILALLLEGTTIGQEAETGRPLWVCRCPWCRRSGKARLTPRGLRCPACGRWERLSAVSQRVTHGLLTWEGDDEGPGLPPPAVVFPEWRDQPTPAVLPVLPPPPLAGASQRLRIRRRPAPSWAIWRSACKLTARLSSPQRSSPDWLTCPHSSAGIWGHRVRGWLASLTEACGCRPRHGPPPSKPTGWSRLPTD